MANNRVILALGAAAAGGVGYYLYTAGGDPKVAQKQAEADASKLSAKVKAELPGQGKQAQKEAEKWGAEAGAKLDSAANKAQAEATRVKADAEAYAKDLKNNTMKKVDDFDRKVETEASKAKSSVSSWFGGK